MRALLLLLPGLALARVPLYEGPTAQLAAAGYVRMFSAAQEQHLLGESALHTTILRAELKLSDDWGAVEAHSRVQWFQGAASLLGAGVTPAPQRTVDTHSELLTLGPDEAPTATLDHDLDRAQVSLFLGGTDLTAGRQAITWGTSTLFTVADVWAAFSPFDLDTSQKRGVDALRATTGLGERFELDLVLADRGSLEDLSGGARLTAYLSKADLYLALARLWTSLNALAGLSAEVGEYKLRAEISEALDEGTLRAPRATLGVDYYASGDLFLGAELHYNGLGVDRARMERGELFLGGSLYAGALASWKPWTLVTLSLTPMLLLDDGSALLSWSAGYEVAESVDLGLGGFHGFGPDSGRLELADLADQDAALEKSTSFVNWPQLVYLQLAAFF